MSHSITHWNGKSWKFSEFHSYNYKKKRAILVCGGPSLKEIDVSKLRGPGKVVLGVNTTYPYVVPDMWMGMDDPRCYDRNVLLEAFPKFLRGPLWKRELQGVMPKDLHNVHYISVKKAKTEELWDCIKPESRHFVWHNNVMAVAMNLLLAMGFREIYIAGCDLSNNVNDYFDDRELGTVEKDRNTRLYRQLFQWLKWLTKECSRRNIKIRSLSPDSKINTFMEYFTVDELNEITAEHTLFKEGPLWNAHTLSMERKKGVEPD